jgi:hypothetical protein
VGRANLRRTSIRRPGGGRPFDRGCHHRIHTLVDPVDRATIAESLCSFAKKGKERGQTTNDGRLSGGAGAPPGDVIVGRPGRPSRIRGPRPARRSGP